MRGKALLIGMLMVAVASVSFTALGFEAYFSDASGNKITEIWEGRTVYIAIEDPYKAACGLDAFEANVLIFDYKTGAYRDIAATFVETGYADGVFVWDQGAIPVGDRLNWDPISYEYPYTLGGRTIRELIAYGFEHVTDNRTNGPDEAIGNRWWVDGNWEYVDRDVEGGGTSFNSGGAFGAGNNTGEAKRFQFVDGFDYEYLAPYYQEEEEEFFIGRFENNDTLVVLVEDTVDGFWGAGQLKIRRTPASISTSLTEVYYGCADIIVTIEDKDESLSSDKTDFVPFFVIVNPGSWNPVDSTYDYDETQTPSPILEEIGDSPTNFCALMRTGGIDPESDQTPSTVLDDPIRWYNIYSMRYIQYPHTSLADVMGLPADDPRLWNWAPAADPHPSTGNEAESLINWDPADHPGTPDIARPAGVARAVFYAQETGSNTGVFRFNFGSLDQLQERLGFGRFPAGTTIAFYYVDPNDFSDMAVTTIHVASPYTRSRVQITDAYGNKVNDVRLGEDGLYFRVEDTKQSMDDCLQESVLVHICDVHGEDDSEYWNLDEISAAAGVFSHAGAMRLDPVWDAVGGYQLVLDDQRFQAFNADTIFVRYNSVRYNPDHVAALGAGKGAIDEKDHFPPEIIVRDPRFVDYIELPYYPWDVSFDTVQVTDYQVFDGTRTTIRMLDGLFNAVTTYRPADQIYIEVTDLDQNEDSRISERISGRWDIPADNSWFRDSSPIWGVDTNMFGDFMGAQFGATGAPDVVPGKVFVFNPRTGRVRAVDLMETDRNSGVFKSTTGLKVSDLGGMESDVLVAFYQDPSNHHDIAIKTIKVEAGDPVPPVGPSVQFDRAQYQRGDTGTITVTEPQFAGQPSITGEDVLVLLDKDGAEVLSWDEIPQVNNDRFRVTFEVPADIATGQIRAVFTHPTMADRTAEATATVIVAALENVTGVTVDPEVLVDEVTFSIDADPVGAVANRLTVTIYDLTRRKVAEVSGTDTASVTWDGGNLRNTAYMYVATVEGPQAQVWVFRGVMAIKR